ncbi:MAG TPA: hypothetical protein VN408_26965 [Actinoplanes sp.]|nr:hypothetical protein [Actinoplanes sp.]
MNDDGNDGNGWAGYHQPREYVPSDDLGSFRPETVDVAEAGGRTVALFGGRSDDRLPLRALDLETGVLLPDRAGLHGLCRPRAAGGGAGR